MTYVVEELVEDALRELADIEAQRTLWTASAGPEVSSLVEARSRLWDDSGLADALERGIVYSEDIDSKLRTLREALRRVDDDSPIETLIEGTEMAAVRAHANELLLALREFGDERE